MKSQKDEITELKKRLKKEKRKNEALRLRIKRLTAENTRIIENRTDSFLVASAHLLYYNDSYFSYVGETLRSSSIYSRWDRFLLYYRRLRMISVSFRVMTYIFAFIQTSAALILLFSVMVVALPAFLIVFLIVLLAILYENYRNDCIIKKMLDGKKIFVLCALTPSAFEKNAFFRANALELSKRTDSFVIIISPFLFSSRGLIDSRAYISAKKEAPNILSVRKNYFYSLRKNVLKLYSDKITFVS